MVAISTRAGVDPSSTFWGDDLVARQRQLHGVSEGGCAFSEAGKFCIFESGLWWILLGTNLEQAMCKKTQFFN